MSEAERDVLLAELDAQHSLATKAAERINSDNSEDLASYRGEIRAAVHNGIERLRSEVKEISFDNALCEGLIDKTSNYLDWLQWTLWDLPYIALSVRPEPCRFREDLAGCALIYFACRVLDDFIDRHFLYRGRRETLLANVAAEPGMQSAAEGLTVIIATLLYFEGLSQIKRPLSVVLDSMKRVLTGTLMEHSGSGSWTEEFYERLIRLKNVDYWRILYFALDPEFRSPLYPFLSDYYAMAQKLNDVQDYARDIKQGRPNFVSLCGLSNAAANEEAERRLGHALIQLGAKACVLPEPDRSIALAKLAQSHDEACHVGYFRRKENAAPEKTQVALELTWQSSIEDVIGNFGLGAIEATRCPVCESKAFEPLFRKQGFQYVQCAGCTHVYVNPRLCDEIRKQVWRELAEIPVAFPINETVHGEYVCRLLRRRAAGPRMLELRLQPGPMPRLARGVGFQVYGAGGGESLRPLFGDRLANSYIETEPLPWAPFDVIVALNILEQTPEPRTLLDRLHSALSPEGLLFFTVSDINSLQFRSFGKQWSAVNPIARYHLFSEQSFLSLLRESGYESVMQIKYPPLVEEDQTRWMRLFRRLGGDEAGELAILARPLKTPDS